MKSAQIGATATPPVRPKSWLSSKPTQITQTRSVVNPENQPSREVPVFPAAGKVKPFCRTAAPVPREHVLQHAIDQIGDAWIQHLLVDRRKFLKCVSARACYVLDEIRFGPRSFGGESGYAPATSSGVIS